YRLLSRYGDDVSSYLSLNVLVADIAPVQNVLAETVADGYRISFSAPDLFHAPDFYDVYFIPSYPNTPQSDWIFVARTNTAEAVVDSLHGGFEHGNFTWAVICKWQSISSVSIAYSNSIFVEMIPQYNYLVGNYPNPFNPNTNIVFWLKEDSPVRLKIYNIRGQLVRKLFSGDMQKGIKSLSFDGRDDAGNALASGTYIYHLNAGSYQRTRQMTLSK
ncbi:MAG TPA: FlgD immunoglobulin-like domain containing protein, partial [Candidatus Cloacimonadota bacterium]|nr:FlgD immunoglobulin-like domain containing protein [Candidatus Cloacimonadota bacterium]